MGGPLLRVSHGRRWAQAKTLKRFYRLRLALAGGITSLAGDLHPTECRRCYQLEPHWRRLEYRVQCKVDPVLDQLDLHPVRSFFTPSDLVLEFTPGVTKLQTLAVADQDDQWQVSSFDSSRYHLFLSISEAGHGRQVSASKCSYVDILLPHCRQLS
ncbi:hypothetical protein RRG08_048273 [Elysia crispata]|uniref:Uncharacterized protein n=1 Tax=Elysia crispata TaxID=231223 RepID=A0AAE1DMP6_9GAST|nr:hypothetical protein RRG08_048273 [Elysia crispata]